MILDANHIWISDGQHCQVHGFPKELWVLLVQSHRKILAVAVCIFGTSFCAHAGILGLFQVVDYHISSISQQIFELHPQSRTKHLLYCLNEMKPGKCGKGDYVWGWQSPKATYCTLLDVPLND